MSMKSRGKRWSDGALGWWHLRAQLPGISASLMLGAALICGCGGRHGHEESHAGSHVHAAPHGGTLIELGSHEFNLELVSGPDGLLNAYVLDAHAENFIRIQAPSFVVSASFEGRTESLEFKAVASNATGETVGSSSAFQAQADWLKPGRSFAGVLQEIDINGTVYKSVSFKFPK